IKHDNFAEILDLGEQRGVLYIAMEFVDGDSLYELQRAVEDKGMALPLGVTLRILADTCGALHAAHELRDPRGTLPGVVHRDVSPQNVMVSSTGNAKLIDFGIAKARDRACGNTATGAMKGKIHYMAPEQAVGTGIDRRTDIFAVGAILYRAFAKEPPF